MNIVELYESFSTNFTFGTNPPFYDNREISTDLYPHTYTSVPTSTGRRIITVAMNRYYNNSVIFSDSENENPDSLRGGTPKAVFSAVTYVTVELIRFLQPDYFTFKGATEKHNRIYQLLVRNNSALQAFRDIGYVRNEAMEVGNFHFEKVS